MNYPSWVTDGSSVPAGVLTEVKKAIYAVAACEKLRRLHNAGWRWVKGEPLSPEEEDLLAANFPGQWPDPPTEKQFETKLTGWWEPRQQEAQATRARLRLAISNEQLSRVDLEGLIG